MLFNDRSGSMSGSPWNALKKACEALADFIFTDDEAHPEDNGFEQVHTIFYGTTSTMRTTNKKSEYLKVIKDAKIDGQTNFVTCYNDILG